MEKIWYTFLKVKICKNFKVTGARLSGANTPTLPPVARPINKDGFINQLVNKIVIIAKPWAH
jgi:hypothetical protein